MILRITVLSADSFSSITFSTMAQSPMLKMCQLKKYQRFDQLDVTIMLIRLRIVVQFLLGKDGLKYINTASNIKIIGTSSL